MVRTSPTFTSRRRIEYPWWSRFAIPSLGRAEPDRKEGSRKLPPSVKDQRDGIEFCSDMVDVFEVPRLTMPERRDDGPGVIGVRAGRDVRVPPRERGGVYRPGGPHGPVPHDSRRARACRAGALSAHFAHVAHHLLSLVSRPFAWGRGTPAAAAGRSGATDHLAPRGNGDRRPAHGLSRAHGRHAASCAYERSYLVHPRRRGGIYGVRGRRGGRGPGGEGTRERRGARRCPPEVPRRRGRVVACGLAMEKTVGGEGNLIDGIDTGPNGFHELFRLQDQGYETLQL